ncbi:hypothetical protein Tco_1300535 [Tanacetum coccineum]
MERGFLGSDVKKKDGGSSKEGVSKDVAGEAPILGDIAKRVKSIDGVINVPKSILRKPARVVSAVSSTQGLGSSNLGSDPTITNDVAANVSNVAAKDDGLKTVESVDCVLPKAAAAKVKGRYENSIVGFFLGKDPSFRFSFSNIVSKTWRKFGFERDYKE